MSESRAIPCHVVRNTNRSDGCIRSAGRRAALTGRNLAPRKHPPEDLLVPTERLWQLFRVGFDKVAHEALGVREVLVAQKTDQLASVIDIWFGPIRRTLDMAIEDFLRQTLRAIQRPTEVPTQGLVIDFGDAILASANVVHAGEGF